MEVVIPNPIATPSMDFDFKANGFSPYLSAPSTPRRIGDFNFFSSAPTSPSRMSDFYREFDGLSPQLGNSPGLGKAEGDDFAFDFCVESEKASRTAEELFDGGKIRALETSIDEFSSVKSPLLSPARSPRSPISQSKQLFRNVLSPRRKKDQESFTELENRRGRDRIQDLSKNSTRRNTRSLSPFRVSQYPWEEEEKQSKEVPKQSKPAFSSSSSSSSSRRWRIKDFFLFRSASEGHARDKLDPFRFRKNSNRKSEDVKNSSFRSTESSGGSMRRVSAHELHYTTNKAVSENLKKKTSLPFKQGILGSLVFGKDKNLFRDSIK